MRNVLIAVPITYISISIYAARDIWDFLYFLAVPGLVMSLLGIIAIGWMLWRNNG
jgi:hypothetical protein